MNNSVEARIFLADQRGCSETPFLRSYHAFNFGAYRHDGREPFGNLYLLNDDTLRAGASLSLTVEEPSEVLLLPVTGGLEYASEVGRGFLEPGQVGVLSLTGGMTYTVGNPYEKECIQVLQIARSRPVGEGQPGFTGVNFDLETKNTLLPLTDAAFIGRFDGRAEGVFPVQSAAFGRLFVFVLSGVFEVVNRLLHAGDGLALHFPSGGEVDFEALSNDALLLLVAAGKAAPPEAGFE